MRKIYLLLFIAFLLNVIIITSLINIGIINKDYFLLKYNSLDKKIVYLGDAKRGRILDRNGKVLVDNKGIKTLFIKDSLIDKEYYAFILSNSLNLDYNDVFKSISNGYIYEDKIIKKNISDDEIDIINNLNLDKLYIDYTYERTYLYDSSINQLFGSIGSIQKDDLNKYLSRGYRYNDIVGISFLEKYYEDYLKGKKSKYIVRDNGTKEKISEGEDGLDLILNIDIDIQLKIDELLKNEMMKAKMFPSSKYYNSSYIVVSDMSGGIIALSSYIYNEGTFVYNTASSLVDSFTVGSCVKGASQSVSYINGVIDKDKYINDGCIKLYSQTKKCSWTNLGKINDIKALAMSSNYYQFLNAIKVSGNNYTYNMKFNPTIDDFNKYRNIFKNFGLGSKTNIDLYEEKLGIEGKIISGDLLLNLSIGQYDTYTPLMLNNYIQTIANNGLRHKLRLASYTLDKNNKKVYINKDEIIDKVNINLEDIKRVQAGLNAVMEYGTGTSYNNTKIKSAGKTGTSETNIEGVNTNTKSFVMYIPYDEPKYAISIISPNLSYKNTTNNYKYPLNTRLSRQIVHILFEK